MARTPLFRALRRHFLLAREARRRGIPVLEYAEERREAWRVSRRRFLQVATPAAAVASAGCFSIDDDDAKKPPEVAVVGGGIAGLACAYRLSQAGIATRVFEAQSRVGGRMYTGRGLFAGNQICELGGELIDTDHESVQALATELGLTLDDLLAETEALALESETYWFSGAPVPAATILSQWASVAPSVDALYDQLNDPDGYITYSDPNGAQAIDQLSIEEWLIQQSVPEPLATLLRIGYDAEYGLVPEVNNLINLMFLISTDTAEFHIYGDSDERFHIHEGNDALPAGLAAALEGRIELGHRLVRIEETSGGAFLLTFLTEGGGTRTVSAGHVVLTIPFTTLRDVEIAMQEPLPQAKQRAIAELHYGNNAKMMLGYSARPWRTAGSDGQCIADLGAAGAPLPFETWDAARGQAGAGGILVDYLSSARADKLPFGTDAERAAEANTALDQLWPSMTAAHDGNVARFHWPSHPWVRGSYSAYQTGDYTSICGAEGERVGNLHFAGEHTTLDWQGYMNGGSETGELAAAEIMSDMGISAATAAAIFRQSGLPRREFLDMALSGRRRRRSRVRRRTRTVPPLRRTG